MFHIDNYREQLQNKKNASLLGGILRGVEREALRTTSEGALAQTPHPKRLGSALTHPQITTDFSEALLEFITPPMHHVDDLMAHLDAIHRFTASHLGDELLWATSMPCVLSNGKNIPVAEYGTSNNGIMKKIYRIGLGHRYGRSMQTVAGVHYNFSLPNAFWAMLLREQNRLDDLQDFKDECYFNLIRNFRRHYWLLIYLFGASPALCKSFVGNRTHNLMESDDGYSFFLPHATSLRMGSLGYQSSAQEALYVCYNSLETYIKSLCSAITKPHPVYEAIGLKNANGEYNQLNTGLLQIENEFYSAIRPKRTARPGETALAALQSRGVEYIEVRCLDINPETPLGFSREQAQFLDIFLLYCALKDSPPTSPEESRTIIENQKLIVNRGREPGLKLHYFNHGPLEAIEWGHELIDNMSDIAKLFDIHQSSHDYQSALAEQKEKLRNSALTPSAKILDDMQHNRQSYVEYALQLATFHTDELKANPVSRQIRERMEDMAEESLAEHASMEAREQQTFDDFLRHYYQQYRYCQE